MAGEKNPRKFNQGGTTSSIDIQNSSRQLQEAWFHKNALIEAKKESYFMQLADTISMPKHHGKKIVQYIYIPLLDDENRNDQGIDATGAVIKDGNLYGSSKDIGVIPSKLPLLNETGGRVNRVSYSRKTIEGTFENFGFFSEYTEDSVNFDSDADLLKHINRETINGAHEITEDALQIDLINSAGTVRYTGSATAINEVEDVVTYHDLIRLGIDLDNNRTPKQTTMITGTRMQDTKTVPAARVLYIGSELIPTIMAMKDMHDNPAFIPVQHYAASGSVLNGEIGSIGHFRIIVVPEMLKWTAGGKSGSNPDKYGDGSNYDVFPMLCVGDKSFTTIGFQTDGKTVKFKQIHKKPGEENADRFDPYGKKGFMSIQWWYGFLALRPERIGLILTTATM